MYNLCIFLLPSFPSTLHLDNMPSSAHDSDHYELVLDNGTTHDQYDLNNLMDSELVLDNGTDHTQYEPSNLMDQHKHSKTSRQTTTLKQLQIFISLFHHRHTEICRRYSEL